MQEKRSNGCIQERVHWESKKKVRGMMRKPTSSPCYANLVVLLLLQEREGESERARERKRERGSPISSSPLILLRMHLQYSPP